MSGLPPPEQKNVHDEHQHSPPYYILLREASLNAFSGAPVPSSSSSFTHPVIEYHYADDPASALLPRSADEAVIILDYECDECRTASASTSTRGLQPSSSSSANASGGGSVHDRNANGPTSQPYSTMTGTPLAPLIARSLSPTFMVSEVRVVDAPGAACTAREGECRTNNKLYIMDTVTNATESGPNESLAELDNPHVLLTQFRERNSFLRRILDVPLSHSPPCEPILQSNAMPSS